MDGQGGREGEGDREDSEQDEGEGEEGRKSGFAATDEGVWVAAGGAAIC